MAILGGQLVVEALKPPEAEGHRSQRPVAL
jgi:hypothetical protein